MKLRSVLPFVFVLLASYALAGNRSSQVRNAMKIRKVVIDAGHGGHDPGALGSKNKESTIALAIALKLGALITDNFPDVQVIYTRSTDVFVELYNRAKIANENKADLFISIHCNSNKSSAPSGTETWVMGLNKSEANLEVAQKENAAILMESDYSKKYDGYDPNSAEAYIIFSLYQNVFLSQSLNLAAKVESQFENNGRTNRGVKQAGFLVLYKTTMPGILVETGFISNPSEELFIASDSGQSVIATGIYSAFKDYKSGVEGSVQDDKVENKTPNHTNQQVVKPPDSVKTVIKPRIDNQPKSDTLKKTETKQEIYFRVQFAASAAEKPVSSPEFKGLNNVKVYCHQGLYKYTSGNENTLESAVSLKAELQKKGYKDAFVVAFLNEQRIAINDAVEMLKKQKK